MACVVSIGGRSARLVARSLGVASVVAAVAAAISANGDDPVPVYVAERGRDIGDCRLPVRPCRSIGYALSQARKGSEIRVAAGIYAIDDIEDVFRLLGGSVRPRGGYDRFDHFRTAVPARRKTVIAGVPAAFRDQLRGLGFEVVADPKPLDADDRRAIETYHASRTSSGPVSCANGTADAHPCHKVDLLARVALADMSARPSGANDIWGFKDLNTEREYALVGLREGLAVFDVTDPTAPFEVGHVPGHPSIWRDVKVFQRYDAAADRWRAYAYVGVDAGGRLSVVDLTGLPNRVRFARRTTQARLHNVFVSNVDYAFGAPAYENGTPLLHVLGGPGRFSYGAFRSFGLADPLHPDLAVESWTGYSHDAVSFRAYGSQALGCGGVGDYCDVLVDFNEDTFEAWDLTDPANPKLVSSTTYPSVGYVHSGWLTEDGRYLFVHDELDEINRRVANTSVRVFDMADLAAPVHVATWEGPNLAIEHNGAVRGNRHFLSHYGRGLVVLDVTEATQPVEVGLFDTAPQSTLGFGGAWGVYPFLPSGNVLISDQAGGLFVLRDRTRASEYGRLAFVADAFGGEEGDAVTVSVARVDGTTGSVAVDYRVTSASADSGDFASSTGTLEWSDGDADERAIAVQLTPDDEAEPIERLHVWLANPRGGATLGETNIASVFVGDSGQGAAVGFAETRIVVDEDAGRVIATVQRRGNPVGAVSVRYDVYSVTAESTTDYLVPQGRNLSWAAGDARPQTIVIALVEDDVAESTEQFEIHLRSAVGATLEDERLAVDIRADDVAFVEDLLLFDAGFGWDVERLARGTVLKHLPARMNFRAAVRDATDAKSVRLTLSGPVSATRVVSSERHFLYTDAVDAQTLPNGDYQLIAAAYPLPDAQGALISALATSFRIDVPPLSRDASLAALSLGGVDLGGFTPAELSYSAEVAHHVASVDVTTFPAHAGASLVIADAVGAALSPHRTVSLNVGDNVVTVAVTAEDRVTTRTYDVTVTRMANSRTARSQTAGD